MKPLLNRIILVVRASNRMKAWDDGTHPGIEVIYPDLDDHDMSRIYLLDNPNSDENRNMRREAWEASGSDEYYDDLDFIDGRFGVNEIEWAERWLMDNFQDIFINELYEWTNDKSEWPDITWKNFEQYCEYRIFTRVFDLGPGEINVWNR